MSTRLWVSHNLLFNGSFGSFRGKIDQGVKLTQSHLLLRVRMNGVTNLLHTLPYAFMEWSGTLCLIPVQLDVHYILYFFLDNISSTCFWCYLHPSSGAQLQCTAIGCVWFGVLLHWSRYWFGTALHLSTVSYSLKLTVLKGKGVPNRCTKQVYQTGVPNQYLLQCNNTSNHTQPVAVRCSCAPDDGCK
jgi:hypothetical protein